MPEFLVCRKRADDLLLHSPSVETTAPIVLCDHATTHCLNPAIAQQLRITLPTEIVGEGMHYEPIQVKTPHGRSCRDRGDTERELVLLTREHTRPYRTKPVNWEA